MIPALIVPILNQPELLDALLMSIDHPVGRVVVIDNGGVTSGWNEENEKYQVIKPGHNIGVAASWNLGMKTHPEAPWWLISNHDITFGPGDLARLEATVNPDIAAVYLMSAMAAFAITRRAVEKLGYFDENFHPAYNEDLDYARRARLLGVPWQEVGFTGTHVGSATIYADAAYFEQNGMTHGANDRYYERKWGGPKEGGETYTTPFDKGGHVGTGDSIPNASEPNYGGTDDEGLARQPAVGLRS